MNEILVGVVTGLTLAGVTGLAVLAYYSSKIFRKMEPVLFVTFLVVVGVLLVNSMTVSRATREVRVTFNELMLSDIIIKDQPEIMDTLFQERTKIVEAVEASYIVDLPYKIIVLILMFIWFYLWFLGWLAKQRDNQSDDGSTTPRPST